jgi:hypothetical protein
MAYNFNGTNSYLTLANRIVDCINSALQDVEPDLISQNGKRKGKWDPDSFYSGSGRILSYEALIIAVIIENNGEKILQILAKDDLQDYWYWFKEFSYFCRHNASDKDQKLRAFTVQ